MAETSRQRPLHRSPPRVRVRVRASLKTRDPAEAGSRRKQLGDAAISPVDAVSLTQSSPFDRSSSATTSAAAHSRASRSLRSRSIFSTASMNG
jgi:hypothetical protein